MIRSLFISVMVFLMSCADPLVDTSYGTTDRQSINGLSVARIVLKEFGDVKEVAYVSKKDFEQSDLIVHFEKYPDPGLYNDIDEALAASNFWIEMPIEELARPVAKKATVLYFYRSTGTEYWFWKKLNGDMTPDSITDRYTEAAVEFFRQRRVIPRFVNRIRSTMTFEEEADRFPVYYRSIPDGPGKLPVQSYLSYKESFPEVSRIAVGISGSFIAHAKYDYCNLITVSSSEPFLDYHMVRPQYRQLARSVFRKALSVAGPSLLQGRPQITLVTGGMRPVWQQAEEEGQFWQILSIAPWNIVLGLFLLTLFLMLWMRWGYTSPPIEAPEPGSRKFAEHFEALGRRLERSGLDSFESLERLKARQRGRIKDER